MNDVEAEMGRPGWAQKFHSIGFGLIVLFLGSLGCSVNILQSFSDQTRDEALLEDAKDYLNERNYTAALAKFASMSSTFLARRDVLLLHASAYAGDCGLDFMTALNSLSNIGATRLMVWLFTSFPSGTAGKETSCVNSETKLKAISSTGSGRTDDENILMAFVAFAKVGTILTRYGDTNVNGVVDVGFDPCSGAMLPSADAKEIATGINIAVDSLSSLSSASVGASTVTSISTVCSALPVPYQALCAAPYQTATGQIDATEEKAIRSLVNESVDLGLGTCTGNAAACACP